VCSSDLAYHREYLKPHALTSTYPVDVVLLRIEQTIIHFTVTG
jgi:hypothetical protein